MCTARNHGGQVRSLCLLAAVIALVLAIAAPALAQQDLFVRRGDPISPELEEMYTRGLAYLARTQSENGSWPQNMGQEPAVVGFAILAFLAHGEDPNSGPYAKVIQRGLDYILSAQNSSTGYIGSSMYNHGFCTLVLAEAYGVVEDPRLGEALKRAVDLILYAQSVNPQGGWRYSPEARDADTTVSGAQLVALYAARNAGFAVPEEAVQKGIEYLKRCQDADGGIGYTSAGGGNGPRTAIAALVFALDKKQKSREARSATQFLRTRPENDTSYLQYYLYYAAQALYQNSNEGWKEWNAANIKTLRESQTNDGSWDGSFGPVFGTSCSLLSLALNYGFLPIYER
ncbi:squalene--hopene cyclase [Verrucomicrobia bacterium LW23]|nr:squalene--hopene cyclase [Verrucomicrobia bacterium LW23]